VTPCRVSTASGSERIVARVSTASGSERIKWLVFESNLVDCTGNSPQLSASTPNLISSYGPLEIAETVNFDS
jgi:hypothetical protein